MRIAILTTIVLATISLGAIAQSTKSPYNHDYSKSWVTKMFLSKPNLQTGITQVQCNLEQALEIIRQSDNLSLGVPKILYLVGWQYSGHDDRYPEFFEVNPALKRDGDYDATQSLRWLIREARKYNTTVSLHINTTDAYDDSKLWDTYLKEDLISKNDDGTLMVIGEYNNRKAYQINYKNEWERGYLQGRVDRLLALLPEIVESGTIHSDAWIARPSPGHNQTVITQAIYQQKALAYWRAKGVDLTSEWYMDYMVGLVPYAWHFNGATQANYLSIPANVYTGSGLNPDIRSSDHDLAFLFGTSCYGEPFWNPTVDWQPALTSDFMLKFPQYYFLNSFDRLGIEGEGRNRRAIFSDDVVVSLSDSTITHRGRLLRRGDTYAIPALWRSDDGVIVYSRDGAVKAQFETPLTWRGAKEAALYEITPDGLRQVKKIIVVKNDKYTIDLLADKPYYLIPIK